MSEKPIKEWNAVTYLRDFINVWLILTPREQAIWDYLQKVRGGGGEYFRKAPQEEKPRRYRLCQRCGEIKELTEFIGKSTICMECRATEKRICKQK